MPAVRVCSDQRDKSIQEQSGCCARPGCWQLQALWSEIHHLQQAACLDAFVWGQEIGEVIAPCWCSSSLLRLLAGKMKATPIISENTPNELSWASPVQLEPPPPYIITKSLYTVYAWWYKRYCQFFFSLRPSFFVKWDFGWDSVPVQLGSHPKASVSLLQYLVTAVLITWSSRQGKRKVNVWASKHTSFAPLPCFQPLDCELKRFIFFFFAPSFKRWNRRCWMMDRCAGIVLFCSALKEIIDLHYSPTHKTQPSTHTHTHTCPHAHLTVPPVWLHHLPHGSPHPVS